MKHVFVLKVNAVTASLFTSQVMEKKADDVVEQATETDKNKEDSKEDQVSFVFSNIIVFAGQH